MENLTTNARSKSKWVSRLFMVAGSFMLINTIFLWVRHFSGYQLSILWPAIPAITALALSVFGLLKLYPLASVNAPRTAKTGASFALIASISLGMAAFWIFAVSVFGAGMPQPAPQGLLVLIAIFMIAMVLAFSAYMVAFLKGATQRNLGYLLSVPVAMWAIMLVVGIIKGMETGLSLDFYTNAIIAAAFLAIGFSLKTNGSVDA